MDNLPFNLGSDHKIALKQPFVIPGKQLPSGMSHLLLVKAKASGIIPKFLEAKALVLINGKISREHVIRRPCDGYIGIDLSDLLPDDSASVSIKSKFCSLADEAYLLSYAKDSPDAGINLIFAPHPDDAEIACTSLYGPDSYIVALTAGNSANKQKKLYFPEMDSDQEKAAWRKGYLRSFNACTTGMLAGVPAEHLCCLGYSDRYLGRDGGTSEPSAFRIFNSKNCILPMSPHPENTAACQETEIRNIIASVAPDRIAVTNPWLDSHPDHIAAGMMVIKAAQELVPQCEILLYAVHAKKERPLYLGDASTSQGLPQFEHEIKLPKDSIFEYVSYALNEESRKQKAILMNNMYDTYMTQHRRWRKQKDQWLNAPRIGKATYFGEFVRPNETFMRLKRM